MKNSALKATLVKDEVEYFFFFPLCGHWSAEFQNVMCTVWNFIIFDLKT